MTYLLLNFPQFHYEDPETGLPAEDWKVYTYKAGSTNLVDTYSNKECTSPNTNPVILDGNGNAVIYTNQSLKIILTEPDKDSGTPHLTQDYLMVPQDDIISGTETSVTNNLYAVSSTPVQTSLSNNQILIFQPSIDNADTMTSQVFTGTGIDDANFYGPYTGTTSGSTFEVEIDSNGTPDTFKWRKDSEAYTTGVDITGDLQALKEGIYVKFAKILGHTIGDKRTLTVERPVRVNLDSLGIKTVYKNVAGTLKVLDGSDIKANYPAELVYTTTSGSWLLMNPGAPDTSKPVAPTRTRLEVADDYNILITDAGNEVVMTVAGKDLNLPAATDFANEFIYLQGFGVSVTVQADGSELIYMPYDTTGANSITIGGPGEYDTIQLQSDSVSWYVLMATGKTNGIAVYTSDDTWTNPGTGIAHVLIVGGGGGGEKNGGGGGGGSTAIGWIDVSGVASVAVTIGQGGAGGSGSGAGNGTDTTFGAYLTAGYGYAAVGPNGGAGGQSTLYTSQILACSFDGYAGEDIGDGANGGDSGSRRGKGGNGGSPPAAGGNYGGGGGGGTGVGVNGEAGADGVCIVGWEL